MNTDDGSLTADTARGLLGDPSNWRAPGGYPESLALCIIDSVQSLRANYNAVAPVLHRYRAYRLEQGGDADTDGVDELLATFDGGAEAWSEQIGTINKAPGTHILKSETIRQAVLNLGSVGVASAADLRDAVGNERREVVERAWLGVKGLGKASWNYLLILAGCDGVKADIMVRRFVTRAVYAPSLVAADRAHRAVSSAAADLGVAEKALDHAIWRYESGRSDEAAESS